MEKLSLRGQKNSTDRINELIEENEGLKAIVSDYTDLKKFAEEAVEKHNNLISEYRNRQAEILELKEENKRNSQLLDQKDQEIIRQKELVSSLDQKLIDFQNHINDLISRFKDLEREKKRHETTIDSLEKYIEVMDQIQKPIKNERGAGRKREYSQGEIDYVVDLRGQNTSYQTIKEKMEKKFKEKEWDIKKIKYIYSRYK